jgi:hypothetical protein
MLVRMTLRRTRALLATLLLLPATIAGAQSSSGPVLRIPGQAPAEQKSPPPAAAPPTSDAAPAASEGSSSAGTTASAAPPAARTAELRVFAVVRDKKGHPVADLTQKDFVLNKDGRAQSDFQLASASSVPLTIGLVAETLPGESKEVDDERKDGAAFLQRLLRAGTDRAFVLHFDRQVELLQDVTSSQEKLARGMKLLSASESAQGDAQRGNNSDGAATRFYFGGNTLYDAIFLSADEVLRGWPGRRVLVVFSSGVDQQSKISLLRAVEAAQRAGTAVYCVYVPLHREPTLNTEIGGPGGYPRGYPRTPPRRRRPRPRRRAARLHPRPGEGRRAQGFAADRRADRGRILRSEQGEGGEDLRPDRRRAAPSVQLELPHRALRRWIPQSAAHHAAARAERPGPGGRLCGARLRSALALCQAESRAEAPGRIPHRSHG